MVQDISRSTRALSDDKDLPANEREAHIVLGVLTAVDRDSGVSQRMISRELGIALGLANAYLKRCVRKGLIKMTQAPLNRYAYYLTPKGFHEKSKLTVEYLKVSFDFFRRARLQCRELFEQCAERGWQRLVLYGEGELAEAAILSAAECPVALVAVVAKRSSDGRFAGLPMTADLAAASRLAGGGAIDAVLLTDVTAPQAAYDRVVLEAAEMGLDATRILVPPLLNISGRSGRTGGALATRWTSQEARS